MHGGKRWAWIILGFLFGCPCLLTGLVLVVLKLGFASTANTLPDEVAAARKAGLPAEPADLRALIAIPEKDNAAGDYAAAMSAFNAQRPKNIDSEPLGHFLSLKSTPAEDRVVLDLLAKTHDALLLFEKAAAKPAVDWKRPWEQGTEVLFPELAQMKQAVKLLSAKAIVAARAGNSAEAFRLLRLGYRMGMHAGQDPTLIGLLVQIALDSISSAAACSVLNLVHDSASLQLAREMMRNLPPIEDYRHALGGELVMQRIGIRNIERYARESAHTDSPQYTGFPESLLIRDAGFRKALEAKVVRNNVTTYLSTQRSKGWKMSKAAWDQAVASIQADGSLENRIAGDFVFGSFLEAPYRDFAYRNMVCAAIEVLSVKQKTGRLPSALPPMGAEGIDPFAEKPLGYKLTSDGFKVYSIDSDGVDDGGLSRAEDTKGKSKTHDIVRVFRVR